MKDRRNFYREKTVDWVAEIITDSTVYKVSVKNISQGGAEVIRPKNWDPQLEYSFKMNLNDATPSNTLSTGVQICWLTDFSIGLKFHEMKMQQKIILNKILSTISRDEVMEKSYLGI